MSNDLINRKALLDSLRGNVLVDVTSELEEAIAKQPTAYDMDKVVNQLKQQAEQYRGKGFEADRERNCDFADKCYSKQCAYLHAIEIVKSGGMNNE